MVKPQAENVYICYEDNMQWTKTYQTATGNNNRPTDINNNNRMPNIKHQLKSKAKSNHVQTNRQTDEQIE